MTHSLRWLLQWAHREWTLETPTLEHAIALTDEGGSPDMKGAAKAYLNLSGKYDGPDDWRYVACRRDDDGFHVTPLRCALAQIRNSRIRHFLHDLIPNAQLRPSDIAQIHGIPAWAEAPVMLFALEMLYREYRVKPIPQRSWVDMSDSQRNAVVAGEAA